MRIFIKLIFFVFINIFHIEAQSPRVFYNISNGWTDLNISGKIAGKFSWQIENQPRRQDAQGGYMPSEKSGNPYRNFNQYLFRPYIHYQVNPGLRLSLMPLGWMGSNRYANGKAVAYFSELRVAPQAIFTQNLGRFRFDSRLRYEFRWIGKNEDVKNHSGFYGGDFSTVTKRGRFRYQFKTTVPLNASKMEDKTLYAQAFNELFVNTGETLPNINLLDQNRILMGLGYRFSKFVSLEAGFMRQSVYRFNNSEKNNVDRNNIIQTNIAINNFEGLFKKNVTAHK